MGTGHSRAAELSGNGLQFHRRCFWCQEGRSFDDFYEPTNTITACNKNEIANPEQLDKHYKDTCGVSSKEQTSKCRKTLGRQSAITAPTLSANSSEGSVPLDLEQQQNKMSSNCLTRHRDDSVDNSFPYSHFTHDTLMQIIRCFPFPSPRSTPEPSSSANNRSLAKARSKSCDTPHSGRPNRIGRSCSSNYEKKCKSTHPAKVNERLEGKSVRRMAAVTIETQKSAIEKLALISADTMAITALPLDCWLKERLKNWVQLSGHEGTIVPATDQTLWKRRSCDDYNEGNAYRALMNDSVLEGFVPRYYREVNYKNESFIEIEDLTALFDNPAIMDIKMGTRTFLESEVQNTKKRNDLYEKMVAMNPCEPTEEEHMLKAVTKLRYMQFRENESSTATLGFRIEAAKMPGGVLQKSFKKVRTREDVSQTLRAFFGEQRSIVASHILQRLKRLRDALQKSSFFRTHEVIGSSLLFMYDSTDANVWMIDFAKSTPVERDTVNHRQEWTYGNHEDGYFKGLDNLIEVMEELVLR